MLFIPPIKKIKLSALKPPISEYYKVTYWSGLPTYKSCIHNCCQWKPNNWGQALWIPW